MSTPHQARVAVIDQRVAVAQQSVTERHAAFAEAIRHSFERLRTGLTQAHARCAAVNEQTWAAYVAELDRGLDELDKEIARAAESTGEPAVAQVLRVRVTELELSGWRLQVSLPTEQHAVTGR